MEKQSYFHFKFIHFLVLAMENNSYGHCKQLWVGSATWFCDSSWLVIVHITEWNCF